jgi:putative DNA primase/helicase
MTNTDILYTSDKKPTISFRRLPNGVLTTEHLYPVPGLRDAASIVEILINCGFYLAPLCPPTWTAAEYDHFKKTVRDPTKGWKMPLYPKYNDSSVWPNHYSFWLKGEKVPHVDGKDHFYKKENGKIKKEVWGDPNCNIGILCGGEFGICVMDWDIKNGIDGLQNMKDKLGEDKFNELFPPTTEFKTASGGEHWIYTTREFIPPSKGLLAVGVDVQGDGNHIVAPGSVTHEGKPYIIKNGRPPVPLTQEALLLIRSVGSSAKKKAVTEEQKKASKNIKTKWTVETAVANLLENPKYQYVDSGRHGLLIKGAGLLRNRLPNDIDLDTAIRLWANKLGIDKNLPGKEDREQDLETVIRDAVSFECVPAPIRSSGEDWEQTLERNSMGNIIPNESNLKKILTNDKDFEVYYDSFSMEIVFDPKALSRVNFKDDQPHKWTDTDSFNTAAWLQESWNCPATKMHITEGILPIASESKSRNLLKEALLGYHSKWDGKSRIETALVDYCQAEDSVYTRMVSKFFFIGAVARAFNPGCKVDNSIVLVNPTQGVGKSTFLFSIAPDEKYVLEDLQDFDVEGLKTLKGKWFVELSEMAGVGRAEEKHLKSFLTRRVDTLRPSYAREAQDFPRSCVMVGTSNEFSFSNDMTGNRRWWPVNVGIIDNAPLAAIKEQLWAEAVEMYLKGERWWPTLQEEANIFAPIQKCVAYDDPWEQRVAVWLDGKNVATLTEVMQLALGIEVERQRSHGKHVQNIMIKLGWKRSSQRTWIK